MAPLETLSWWPGERGSTRAIGLGIVGPLQRRIANASLEPAVMDVVMAILSLYLSRQLSLCSPLQLRCERECSVRSLL